MEIHETMEVWKLTRQLGGRYYSLLAAEPLRLRFIPGEWLRADHGPIFCYDDYRKAQIIAAAKRKHCIYPVDVWRASAQTVTRCPAHLPMLTPDQLEIHPPDEIINRWWDWWPEHEPPTNFYPQRPMSPEIVLCRWLKLEEIVYAE